MDRKVFSWCLYDFANSSYSAVIAAVIFPVYFVKEVASSPAVGDLWWGRAISLSMAVVALTSPIVGGISDYAGMRKRLLITYSLLSIVSVSLLSFVGKGMIFEAFLLILIANIGMEGSLVFYNAYLPDITPRDHHGRVSGWGFGFGYAGSIVSLLAAMLLLNAGKVYLSWPLVSCFFLIFALPAFFFLPPDCPSSGIGKSALNGLINTLLLLKEILKIRDVRRFLISYWFYKDAVNTIIVFSSIYASVTLSFTMTELVLLYLIVQITAMIGSFGLSAPADRWGSKRVVIMSLILWILVTLGVFFVDGKPFFWGIASFAGLGLGSLQAASRSLYSGFIPHGREGEYFGIFALAGKTSAILGPLLFGLISSATGNQRFAVLSLLIFFAAGLLVLMGVKDRRALY